MDAEVKLRAKRANNFSRDLCAASATSALSLAMATQVTHCEKTYYFTFGILTMLPLACGSLGFFATVT